MKRVFDKPNNIVAMHKLPAGRSKFKLGLELGLLAYETGCAGKKMKSSLGRSFCELPLALVMEKAIHNFADKNSKQTCQLIRARTWR